MTPYLDHVTHAQKALGSAGLANGAATLTTKLVPAGSHTVTAVYNRTANFQPGEHRGNAVEHRGGHGRGRHARDIHRRRDQRRNGAVARGGRPVLERFNVAGHRGAERPRQGVSDQALARGPHSITVVYLGNSNFSATTAGAIVLTV
jgi:hypothetical protein